jgi:hypothetical protein
MKTITRTREQGTQETICGNPEDRIEAFRRIVRNHQYEKIDGTMIDGFTASVVVQVYDALNETNKAKFASMPAGRMGIVAYKLNKEADHA